MSKIETPGHSTARHRQSPCKSVSGLAAAGRPGYLVISGHARTVHWHGAECLGRWRRAWRRVVGRHHPRCTSAAP